MWRRKKSPKVLAEQLCTRFDGVLEVDRGRLDLYWYSVKFRYRQVELIAVVHATKASLRLEVPKFRNKRQFACSFGEPAPPGYSLLKSDLFDRESIPVHASCVPGDADETIVRAFLSDPENCRDILELRLTKDERLAIYSNGIEARFATSDPDTLAQRLDPIVRLVHRNRKQGTLRLFSKSSRQMIPGEPLSAVATESAEPAGHIFGGDITAQLPACINCDAPLHLLATLDTQDPELAVKRKPQRWLHILSCLNCDSYASPLFWKREDDVFELIHQERGQSFGEFPRFLEARELRLAHVEPQQVSGGIRSPRHRVGGAPDWIQAECVPVCPACDIDMTFVAQIDTDNGLGFQFGGNGILYAFICEKCGIMSSFAQGY